MTRWLRGTERVILGPQSRLFAARPIGATILIQKDHAAVSNGAAIPGALAIFQSALLAFLLLVQAPPGSALERFFIGTTEGSGTASVIMAGRHGVKDRARGRMDSSGALLLDQIVEEEGKPPRRRAWRLARAGGNRITGTISDARGTVAGELSGATLHLKYRLKEGASVEQWITLQPGGRTARNRMVFHRFGMKVATMDSVIRKVN